MKKNVLSYAIASLVSLSALSAYAQTANIGSTILPEEKPEAQIYDLKSLRANNIAKIQKVNAERNIPTLRAEAIKDIALRLGASSGLASEYKKYEKITREKSAELDRMFDFEQLKLSAGVLPPVLSQGFSNFELNDPEKATLSSKNMKIEEPARIVSVYPTWRDYLIFDFKPAEIPQANFMPKTKAEKELWDKYVKIGWEQGVLQAQEIYNQAYAKMERDYNGMILYKIALMNGTLDPAIVASANLGTTTSADGKELSVNHEVIQITNQATFKRDDSTWKNKYPATYHSLDGKLY